MSLTPGTKLGPYEILAPIGAGGMGEVYRARDTKLGRDVAIKALPSEVAEEPERLARFRRKAQLLASLNHPHIGVSPDSQKFLVALSTESSQQSQLNVVKGWFEELKQLAPTK